MSRARRLLVTFALLGAPAAGCIFLVPSADVGPTCSFDGADTACGACIAKSCQNAVNGCCDESNCRDSDMPLLDLCASGEGCALLTAAPGATSLAACVAASCSEACGITPESVTTCVRFGDDGCRCTSASELADAGGVPDGGVVTSQCSESSFSSSAGACCAFQGWPNGGACLCLPVRCLTLTDNPNSCVCGLYSKSDGFTESSTCSLGQPCCEKPGACECNEAACAADQTEVPDCEEQSVADSIGCTDGTRIASCQ